ncbi:hypothetical protein [Microbacterium sp. NPDC056234]|uniref:hypothetical protein n=1 Tax=Microbacterium sp. NPDC056234 TaxID=3345757 RepID=UPI0035D93766
MYSTEIANDGAPEQIWGRHAARRFVNDAIEALEEAGVALAPLITDTQWQANGVRKLHGTIDGFREQCAGAESSLRMRLWELEAAR